MTAIATVKAEAGRAHRFVDNVVGIEVGTKAGTTGDHQLRKIDALTAVAIGHDVAGSRQPTLATLLVVGEPVQPRTAGIAQFQDPALAAPVSRIPVTGMT
ncbi:hypothetical protein B1808_13595 [Pseudofulvimonas gallinarii]|nr:hypothetical protein B1808_13595 [Pseudofulvimonas gallinarii]